MEMGKEQEATYWHRKQTPKPIVKASRGAGTCRSAIGAGMMWQLSGAGDPAPGGPSLCGAGPGLLPAQALPGRPRVEL